MASKLTKWINAHLKAKGKSPKEAQKDAGKYSSISAAKKAGSLYYTDKKGRVMIAAYAEDLAKPLPEPKPMKPEKIPEAVTKKEDKKTETVSDKEVEKSIKIAKAKIKIADTEASVEAAKKALAAANKKIEIHNRTSVLNKKAREFKEEKIALRDKLKEKIKDPEITVTIIKASPGPLKRKPTAKELNSESDQDSLDKALRMDNRVEEERDNRRSRNKVEIVDGKRKVTKRKKDTRTRIEKEADLLEQERKKNYKRGKATKRAKGGLIDMRSKGLFR
jgi:hypothetical protein